MRKNLLERVGERPLPDLLEKWQDGAVKLGLLHKLLELRRDHREVFAAGDYIPLSAIGVRENHVVAFARHAGAAWLVAVAPRFTMRLSAEKAPLGKRVWRDTEICLPENAPRRWLNVLTGKTVRVSEMKKIPLATALHRFPVALLTAFPD